MQMCLDSFGKFVVGTAPGNYLFYVQAVNWSFFKSDFLFMYTGVTLLNCLNTRGGSESTELYQENVSDESGYVSGLEQTSVLRTAR